MKVLNYKTATYYKVKYLSKILFNRVKQNKQYRLGGELVAIKNHDRNFPQVG